MDWKQFFASVIGSVAWPAVVAVLLYLLRSQLSGLAERLKELSFPGGVKASFRDDLEVGRAIADRIPHEPEASAPPEVAKEIDTFKKVAVDSPPGAIILSFLEVEKKLRQIAIKLGKPYWSDQRKLMRELAQRDLIDPETEPLFMSLRNARNSAAHGGDKAEPSAAQAFEYIRQAAFLTTLLQKAADRL